MFLYILQCADGSYYTGVTNDLSRRLDEHMRGASTKAYTSTRLPVELVYQETFYDPLVAIAREKQIKGWSRRKKEALISGDDQSLRDFSEDYYTKRKRGGGGMNSPM